MKENAQFGLGDYSLRWSRRRTRLIWIAWLIVSFAVSLSLVVWHLNYAAKSHPGLFPLFTGLLVSVAFFLPLLYQFVRRRRLWRWEPLLFAVFAAAILLCYEPLATVVAGWIFVAAYAGGRFTREHLDLPASSPVSELLLSSGIGFGLLLCLLTVLGVVGGFHVWAFLGLLAFPCLVFHRQVRGLARTLRALGAGWSSNTDFRQPLPALFVVIGGVLLVCTLMVVLAPSITFDPLKFHLPLAQHYAATGHLSPLASEWYGYNPQGFEILLALAWSLAGQAGAQMIAPVFFLLALIALYAIGRECEFSPRAAFAACIFTASIPFIHWTGTVPKNDLGVAFFHLAGLYAFLRWRATGNFRWIHLGVFFAAISMNFKHPAALGVLALGILYAYAAWRQPHRIRAMASCAAIFVLFASFWPVRTYWLTGDPIFPNNVVHPIRYSRQPGIPLFQARIRRSLLWPLSMQFAGRYTFQSFTKNPVGVYFLLFLPVWGLLRRRRSAVSRACGVFIIVYLLGCAISLPILRFAIAPLAVLAMFTAARLESWYSSGVRFERWTLHLTAAFSLMFALCVILILEVNAPQFQLFSNRIDKTQYLRQALFTYPSLENLRHRVKKGDPVLGIGNCSRLYAPNPNRFYCIPAFSTSLGLEIIRRAVTRVNHRYVILPVDPYFDQALGLFAEMGRRPFLIYNDGHFRTYKMLAPMKTVSPAGAEQGPQSKHSTNPAKARLRQSPDGRLLR